MSVLDPAAQVEPAFARVDTPANALADKVLHVLLYITVLSSFYVVVEPAPFEYLAVVLGLACVVARVPINRMILPLLILLLIRDAGGAIGLLQILDSGWLRMSADPDPVTRSFEYSDSIRFLATSFYLGLSGVMFACICTQDTMRRIATLRSAYITAAVVASLLGTIGYFALHFSSLSGLEIFSFEDRAVGGFKDPNVLACFLIPPLLWLIQGIAVDKIRLHNLIASIIVFIGLLLAFSRAAWGTFAFTAVLLMYFLYVTQTDNRVRKRIVFFVVGSAVAAVAIFEIITSIDVVNQMFEERARLVQYYDIAGGGSRLMVQQDSVREILAHPLGMGPWGFARAANWASHNTYLGTMLNHGWVGGAAYVTLIVLTLWIGFRALWVRTPWQTFLIATYLAFLGLALEAFIVDTDHFRHFYLLLGLVWGLTAATRNYTRQKQVSASVGYAPA